MSEADAIALQERLTGKKPVKKKRASRRSNLEQSLELQLQGMDLPEWKTDYRFHSVREWKLDFAWPDHLFAVEVDGTIRNGQGDHQTTKGMTNDCQKQAEAMLWGWRLMRCTAPMVKSGEAADYVQRILTRIVTERQA